MLSAGLLSYAGFSALCLAMDRHHQEVLGRRPSPARKVQLRVAGWALLGLSLWISVISAGWAMGLVRWTAVLMSSAVFLVWLLPYRPRWALVLAAVGVLLGLLAAVARW
ncbi:DUF3325 domain-containing protein [Pseudomonas rhizosphaerae]|uniref:DUF3325 domain-containing protein n=1 Tax=Pseudomonas rhizosphaerae TaxID=216142 RepID=UPI002B45A252|nr:DUF3325 domain-containing protein [Pseudomonas rhizosphaerae]MEB2871689.1 DUF3325 domain-containing protein [Pseudomonas rhizosphaerae]